MKGARWLIDSLRAKQPFNKDLGQHFLVNDELIDFAVKHSNVSKQDHVLEIGPGPGVLTEALLNTDCKVTAIELDEGAVKHLTEILAPEIDQGKLVIISGDALNKKWPNDITKVVSNIPYQISSPLIDIEPEPDQIQSSIPIPASLTFQSKTPEEAGRSAITFHCNVFSGMLLW